MTRVTDRVMRMAGEEAVAAVRWILLMGTAAVVLGSRSGAGASTGDWIRSVAVVTGMAFFVFALSAAPRVFRRYGVGDSTSEALMQGLDVVAMLGVLYAVHDFMPDSSWAVLAIPIVLSSLRLGALGVLCVWFSTSVLYALMTSMLMAAPGDVVIPVSRLIERAGILLAIAACLALLTRWLQSGWLEQAQQAAETERRLSNARTIDSAGREMRGGTRDEVMAVTLQHAVELGFEAVTMSMPGMPMQVIGDGSIVPADEVVDAPSAGIVELTVWEGPGDDRFSVASYEPVSQAVICGWASHPPDRLQAEALGDLVAQSSTAVEVAELFRTARYEADHDPLTGLANRASFERRARAVVAHHQSVALMYLDLDHFKSVNDSLGHGTGDLVLQAVARILERHVTDDSVVSRFGGDEFVGFLVGASAVDAETCAQQIHTDVQEWAAQQDFGGVTFGVSIGIARAVAGGLSIDELRLAADDALYKVKASGRGATSIVDLPTPIETASAPLPPPIAERPVASAVPEFPPVTLLIPALHLAPLAPPTIDWQDTKVPRQNDPDAEESRGGLALTGSSDGQS